MSAIILICSLAIAAPACDTHTARSFMRAPETFSNPVTCAMHAQAFAAELSSTDVGGDEYVKVACIRTVNPNQG